MMESDSQGEAPPSSFPLLGARRAPSPPDPELTKKFDRVMSSAFPQNWYEPHRSQGRISRSISPRELSLKMSGPSVRASIPNAAPPGLLLGFEVDKVDAIANLVWIPVGELR